MTIEVGDILKIAREKALKDMVRQKTLGFVRNLTNDGYTWRLYPNLFLLDIMLDFCNQMAEVVEVKLFTLRKRDGKNFEMEEKRLYRLSHIHPGDDKVGIPGWWPEE